MHAILLTIMFLAVPPVKLDASEVPKTRVFVRTNPSGATITLDGKELGKSDNLFIVPPGVRKITIELEGYASEVRTISVADGRITRRPHAATQRGRCRRRRSIHGRSA